MPRCLFILFSFALLLVATQQSVRAQEQERKLFQRLLRPDTEMAHSSQNKTFTAFNQASIQTSKRTNVKEFPFTKRFGAKEFQTKEFRSKTFWSGDLQFAAKEATTKESRDANKRYETKSVEVKEARESGRDYDTRAYANIRETHERGKAQGALDKEHEKGPKTIDDVRALLNKNK